MSTEIRDQLTEAMKAAMRAKQKQRLGTIRLALSEVKRIEVDERIDVEDERMLGLLDKMVKQRRDSAKQYQDADRPELADAELFEIEVLQEFLPAQLSEQDVTDIVAKAIADSGAQGMKDMGKVMGLVKPQVQGRGDMGIVSKLVKAQLA